MAIIRIARAAGRLVDDMNLFSKIVLSLYTGDNYFHQEDWATGKDSVRGIPFIQDGETIEDQNYRYKIYDEFGITGGHNLTVNNAYIFDGVESIMKSNASYDEKYLMLDALDIVRENYLDHPVGDYSAWKCISQAFDELFYGRKE